MENKKTVVFATATYGLSETQRMTQIARELKNLDRFDVVVAHYCPEDLPFSFAKIIKDEGLDQVVLEPAMTEEDVNHIFAVDRGEKSGELLPAEFLECRLEHELDFLRSMNVLCVVTGFCLSFYLSCRLLDIPIISVLSGSFKWWMSRPIQERRIPDMMSGGVFNILPKKWIANVTEWFSYHYKGPLKTVNRILINNNKKPFSGFMDFLGGDYFFASDIPEYIPINNCDKRFIYTGPLIGRLKGDVPKEAYQARKTADEKGWPLVYFAMGSSGKPEFVKRCLEILAGQKMIVLSPMKNLLHQKKETQSFMPATNIFLTEWLPADKTNPMCDIALIHGGQGTVYTAILSRTPFCAIGNGNIEQEFNVEAGVFHGFARLFRRQAVKPEQIIQALLELYQDKNAYKNIEAMAKLIERPEWNGEIRAAKTILEIFKE
jgi:UDP:flavonoid glycosyltransferase YjiC (YdhE family)